MVSDISTWEERIGEVPSEQNKCTLSFIIFGQEQCTGFWSSPPFPCFHWNQRFDHWPTIGTVRVELDKVSSSYHCSPWIICSCRFVFARVRWRPWPSLPFWQNTTKYLQFHSLRFAWGLTGRIWEIWLWVRAVAGSRGNVSPQVKALGGDEYLDDYAKPVRDLGFALMNAGIRVNLNEANTLKNLASSKIAILKNSNSRLVY